MTSTWTLASPTIPRLLQSRAIPALPFLPTQAFSEDMHSPPPPEPRRTAIPLAPRPPILSDISPTTSSPSLYSHAPSYAGHGKASSRQTQVYYESDEDLSEEEDPRRMSMVSGPKVRKYSDIPWGNDEIVPRGSQSRSHAVSPSTSTNTAASGATTLKGFSNLFTSTKPKHLLPSVSALSLASDVTASTNSSDERPHPVTPKSGPAYLTRDVTPRVVGLGEDYETPQPFVRGKGVGPKPLILNPVELVVDRPVMASGSPGFGLISLEVAQERERLKSRPARVQQPVAPSGPSTATLPSEDPTPRIRGKKSGLMKYFNRDRAESTASNVPAVPTRPALERGNSTDSKSSTRGQSVWSDTGSEPTWPVKPTHLPAPAQMKPLELRPVSMTFTRGLPSSYLSDTPASPVCDAPAVYQPPTGDMATLFKEQITNAKKAWRVQLFELEAQIRELRDELEEARRVGHGVGGCDICGCSCGGVSRRIRDDAGTGSVMDRARVKTAGARGVFGSGSLYEWE
jgi:hypothetical protein